jgi:hypothetical protein
MSVAGLKPVDEALADVRALFDRAGGTYKIVGGLAVIHHGYARFTEDVDVLVEPSALPSIVAEASNHGCSIVSPTRLRHDASGVTIDLLIAGSAAPRAGVYPSPAALEASDRDPAVVGLAALIQLKLAAHRHRDLADVVELLKLLDDARYIDLESKIPAASRPELARLRDDALEEMHAADTTKGP